MNIQASKNNDIPYELADPYKINDAFISVFQNSNENCFEKIAYYRTNKFNFNKTFEFSLVDVDTISKTIGAIKSNSSGVDNISLEMLKLCMPVISIYITHIVNCCLESGYFPDQWKKAVVVPLPKKNKSNYF